MVSNAGATGFENGQEAPYRILYIDDETALLGITASYLQKTAGFAVDTAASAADGLLRLKKQAYDAIISDYEMPEMNGIDLLSTLRQAGNTIPFIIFTGRGREEVAIAALNAGADFYLQKGGKPRAQFAELANAVRQLIQRHRAEERLHRSETEKERILDSMEEAMIYILPDYTIGWANRFTGQMVKKPPDEIIGHPCYEVTWGRTVPCDHCRIPAVRATGEKVSGECTLPSGRIVDVTTYPVKEEDGTIRGFIERATDITKYRDTQKALEDQKYELELTVNATTDGIWKWHIPTDKLWFSSRYYTMLGYAPGAFQADFDHWLDLIHPDDRATALGVAEAYLRDRPDTYENEFRLRTADGDYRWIHASARVVEWDADNRPVRMIGNHEDITALRENEEKYRTLFNAAHDMIYLHELKSDGSPGRILEANAEACQTMGYTHDEFRAMYVLDLNDPTYEDDIHEVADAIRQKSEHVFEWRHLTKDGRPVPVEVSTRAFQMQGQCVVLAIVRDISVQKAHEAEITALTSFYESIIERVPDGIWVTDATDTVTYASSGLARITGIPVEKIVGRTLPAEFNERVMESFWQRFAAAKTADGQQEYRVQVTTPAGRETCQAGWFVPQTDSAGRYTGMIVTTRDITREVERNEQLAISRFSVDHLPESVFWIQEDGTFWYANPAACRELGYTSEEIEHLRVDTIDPDYPLSQRGEFWERLNDENVVRIQTIHHRKDGSTLPVEVTSHMINIGEKALEVAIARDMTDQLQTEEAILLANKKVSLLNSITRHDIINLITTQMLSLELLRETDDPAKREEYLESLETSTRRIEKDILFTRDYQNLGAGAPVWQDAEECIRQEWEVRSGRGQVSLEVDLDGVQVLADSMLPKVFGNLMDNAFRHGGGIRTIRFSAEERGTELALCCEDDGTGIPPEKRKTLFQPVFNQKHGYGLYLISEILSITGITITEEGREGEGARFVIHIPENVWRK